MARFSFTMNSSEQEQEPYETVRVDSFHLSGHTGFVWQTLKNAKIAFTFILYPQFTHMIFII